MYTILLVDDERNERTGIEKLIQKYNFPLNVVQAQNGEEALNIIQGMHIDILLTDIKMPFMNGMELIEAVRKQGFMPFCIIYSAYGEFEYAQNAIKLGVVQYLLKPINLDDFQSLFEKVIRLCNERDFQNIQEQSIREELKNLEKTYLLKNFLFYLETDKEELDQLKELELEFGQKDYLMLVVSSYSFIFSLKWKNYKDDLIKIAGENTIIVNISDFQTMLLIPVELSMGEKKKIELCERLIHLSKEDYQSEIFAVCGSVVRGLANLRCEYKKIEEILDYQFFMSESTYVLYDKDYILKKQSDMLPVYFNKILTCAKLNEYQEMKSEFEKVFQYIDKNIGFSSVYIKYNFTEVMKQLCVNLNENEKTIELIGSIYEAKSLEQVKLTIFQFIDELSLREQNYEKEENRLVSMVKNIVRNKYNDSSFSVACVADELQVTQAYLSTMFKA